MPGNFLELGSLPMASPGNPKAVGRGGDLAPSLLGLGGSGFSVSPSFACLVGGIFPADAERPLNG